MKEVVPCNEQPVPEHHVASRNSDLQLQYQLIESRIRKTLCTRSQAYIENAIYSGEFSVEGLRIVKTERGVQVFLICENTGCHTRHKSSLEKLYEQLVIIEGVMRRPMTMRERVHLFCRSGLYLLTRSGSAHNRLMTWSLEMASHATAFTELLLTEGLEARKIRLQIIGALLGEPDRRVSLLLRRQRFLTAYFFCWRLRHYQNVSADRLSVDHFVWPEEKAYERMIRQNKASRVLVTIHMGDFTGAMKRISMHASADRSVITLKREQDSPMLQQLFHSGTGDHNVLLHGHYDPVQIVAKLRKGSHTLNILFDLGDDFGETTEVSFFGHRARFVKGPAMLAIMGKARILPFVAYQDGDASLIEMHSEMDVALRAGETLNCACQRITQQMVKLAEAWILRSPEQWKFLPELPKYLHLQSRTGSGHRSARDD